jgi:post-segregation antitoxin (ccd killing protein)
MRNPTYDRGARKRTVSLTLNADLYAKPKGAGINLSKVAEEALAQALAQRSSRRTDHSRKWSASTTWESPT